MYSIIIQVAIIQQQMKPRTQEDILTDIRAIKKKIYVQSTELQSFLMYLDQEVFKRGFLFCGPAKVKESPQFMRAFNTMNSIEKSQYYLECLRDIHQLSKDQYGNQSTHNEKVKQYQIIFRLNGLKEWTPTAVSFDSQNTSLYFHSSEKYIDLNQYVMRQSKSKDRHAFVLQSFVPKNNIQTIRISHSDLKIFQDLQTNIKHSISLCLRERLSAKFNIGRKNPEKGKKIIKRSSISAQFTNGNNKKSLRQLIENTSKNINFTKDDFNAIANTLINRAIIDNLDNYREYEKITDGYFINLKKNKVRKVYYFNGWECSKQWIIGQLGNYQNFKIWKNSLFMISLLANIPAQNTQIFHQIDTYKDSTQCDYVYLRHFFQQGKIAYFIDKSISTVQYGSHETSQSRGNIQYCIWRVKEEGNKLQVLVECQLSHVKSSDIYNTIDQHIGEVEKIILSKTIEQNKIRGPVDTFNFKEEELSKMSSGGYKQFTSYEGLSQSLNERDQSQFYTIYNDNQLQNEKEELGRETNLGISTNKYSYQIHPLANTIKQYRPMKNDQFFDCSECIVNENGDLLFINEKKIKAQSSVLNKVLKKIGTNLFSGKSVLGVSLPIEIFASDTNLERLCKGNAYAPLFLQNKLSAPPLQKMKAVISYSIGNILLYIEMAKPFNPILGETYQGFVDGCPIYGEQISHHPPISSFFMVGRGYFIHANLQAKVNFGLNNASGINEGLYKVAFDSVDPSKNVIAFVSPPGELSGLIFGQRKLALNSKTQYFDENNQIFCEISWGKNKKQKQGNFTDYMEGKIVKLHKFQDDISKIKISKHDQLLGIVSGRWTQKIYFQNEVIFDINQMRPYKIKQQNYPLQSDVKYRKDRVLVGLNKFDQAQKAKEQLQELQRRDRKLRKNK